MWIDDQITADYATLDGANHKATKLRVRLRARGRWVGFGFGL